MNEKMIETISDAYENPAQKFCFYSANGAGTGSDRMNRMTCWDWTPQQSIGVEGNSTCVIPLALGCEPLMLSENHEWLKSLIHDPTQVEQVPVPDPWEGRTGRILQQIQSFKQNPPREHLIRNPDIQSPLGVAELMWDESFYIALIEAPEAVHELLDKITRFTIDYIRAIQDTAGDRYNPCGFPLVWANGAGTMIADDTMTLLSPEMHAEFSVPYINRIADAVGPIYYHSCSWREPYYDNIRQLRNVRALNWNPGNSDDPAKLIKAFSGQAVLALHLCKGMHRDHDVLQWDRDFVDEADFFNYFLDLMDDKTCMYWWFSDIRDNGEIMEHIYDMLAERGYAPSTAS